jgi:metallophosphoesterase (TIGR00282 family)
LDKNQVRIFIIGDVVGEPGRKALFLSLAQIIHEKKIDFVIANGENAAGGFGITGKLAGKLYSYGVDCITSGNHIWRNKDIFRTIQEDPKILRPANYPKNTPGRGWALFEKNGYKIAVLNLLGRVFMEPLDCPFRTARKEIANIRKEANIIIVDFHGEATSEKMAMGWYLDGMVSAVVGTHTHIQTADERLLPGGTAYITDAGMTGPFDSIIGMQKENAIRKFVTFIPSKFQVAENDIHINGVVVTVEVTTGKASMIERMNQKVVD